MLALAVLAHTAAILEAVDVAPLLRKELAPFTGKWVVLNCYGGGGAVWGPVDHALARLARLEQDPLADIWFERAATQATGAPMVLERIGADRAATQRRRPANRAAS